MQQGGEGRGGSQQNHGIYWHLGACWGSRFQFTVRVNGEPLTVEAGGERRVVKPRSATERELLARAPRGVHGGLQLQIGHDLAQHRVDPL